MLQKILHFEQEIGVGSIRSSSTKLFFEPLIEDEIVLITPNIKNIAIIKETLIETN